MSNLQLLGLFNCLAAPFLSPLITAHPFLWFSPPQCLWMGLHQGRVLRTTWTTIQPLVKADVQGTTYVTSIPTTEDMAWA